MLGSASDFAKGLPLTLSDYLAYFLTGVGLLTLGAIAFATLEGMTEYVQENQFTTIVLAVVLGYPLGYVANMIGRLIRATLLRMKKPKERKEPIGRFRKMVAVFFKPMPFWENPAYKEAVNNCETIIENLTSRDTLVRWGIGQGANKYGVHVALSERILPSNFLAYQREVHRFEYGVSFLGATATATSLFLVGALLHSAVGYAIIAIVAVAVTLAAEIIIRAQEAELAIKRVEIAAAAILAAEHEQGAAGRSVDNLLTRTD